MLNRLRASFAAKLLLAGLILALVIIGGVSAYLLISRDSQTRAGALSNADNRAAVMREVLLRFTGAQSLSTAQGIASQAALVNALLSKTPQANVPALFAGSPPVDLADEVLIISDARGTPIYVRPDAALRGLDMRPFEATSALRDALAGATCSLAPANTNAGACGVDLLGGTLASYAVAVPVNSGGKLLGVVSYIAPLHYQLDRFTALFQFPTAFIPLSDPRREIRQRSNNEVSTTTPPVVLQQINLGHDIVHATYVGTDASGRPQDVAGSFAAIHGPDGRSVSGYLGVEVPLAPFIGDERTDELTLGVITLFVLLLTAIAVILFVEALVRRPIRRLERGVTRIADGDYTSPMEVRSTDELGRLARSVNRMRDNIRRYTSEIQEARARLDRNVERVSGVSRALTTTTGGVSTLEHEVVRAAASLIGEGSAALLAARQGDELVPRAVYPEDAPRGDLRAWPNMRALIGGAVVRENDPELGSMLALPMYYQGDVVGAVVVAARKGSAEISSDEQEVLAVLANNAAIAMENARLYEQEKETVRRLRELDAMKTDFLSTVQHELRTPLTAILGLADLVDMCWDMWDDAPKLDAVRDIQIAARNLYEIVETIIDFSALDDETLTVHPETVAVADALTAAVTLVAERYKGGLPVPVDVDVDPSVSVYADPDRFGQIMRALVDNAVKFSDGRGRVQVRATVDDKSKRTHLEVIDEGIGIAEQDIPRVFERFFQVDNTATRRYGGTGMGLALVRRLVLAHGATVHIESEVDKGARVILDWPTAAVPFPPPPPNGAAAGVTLVEEKPVPVQ